MKIDQILVEPEQSLLYMERLVNNGSPSRFSFQNTTSSGTCPLYVDRFYLSGIQDNHEYYTSYGNSECGFWDDDLIFLHPDWQGQPHDFPIIDTGVLAFPTSSSRTVKLDGYDVYIKLYYPGILGRISRELEEDHILSSIDINNLLFWGMRNGRLPDTFAFLPERGGKLYKKNSANIGYMIRESNPVGSRCSEIDALIPAFSLFSVDRENEDRPLIIQILERKSEELDYLLNQIFFPVIDCYFSCVFGIGIQPEMHSQNFLMGIDNNLDIKCIVIRDLESADKDIPIMERLGTLDGLKSRRIKCIDSSQYNYKIKHSFMFDHKLGEYFFDELISCVRRYGIDSERNLDRMIQSYVTEKYGAFTENFFPEDNRWYKFKPVLIDRTRMERPYVSLPNPKYR